LLKHPALLKTNKNIIHFSLIKTEMIRCGKPKRFGLSDAVKMSCPPPSNPEMEDRLKQEMAKRAQQDAELWGNANPEEKDTNALLSKK
jgi:hypothetical protein